MKYIRENKTIISCDLNCSRMECKESGCCFPDCSKEVKEYKSINEAKRKSRELQKNGHIVEVRINIL